MKKLQLKRESLRDLSVGDLRKAAGGNQTVDCSFQISICEVGCLQTRINCVSGPCTTLPSIQD